MDFSVAPQTQEMLSQMREFVEQELFPVEPEVAARGFGAMAKPLGALRQKVKDLGWWCPQIEQKHGGLGLSLLEHGMVSEVLGRSPLGHYCFNCQAPDAGNMEILIQYGSPEQQERFLAPRCAATCVAFR